MTQGQRSGVIISVKVVVVCVFVLLLCWVKCQSGNQSECLVIMRVIYPGYHHYQYPHFTNTTTSTAASQDENMKNLHSSAVNRGDQCRLNYSKTVFGRGSCWRTHDGVPDPELYEEGISPAIYLSSYLWMKGSPSELVPHFLDQSYRYVWLNSSVIVLFNQVKCCGSLSGIDVWCSRLYVSCLCTQVICLLLNKVENCSLIRRLCLWESLFTIIWKRKNTNIRSQPTHT